MKIFKADETVCVESTTVLCIAAHQDDIEMMASFAIGDCYESKTEHFTGVVMTDGANSPRIGAFADFTAEQMIDAREKEQIKAAQIGKYCALFMCGYPSGEIKQKSQESIDDIVSIIEQTKPHTVIIHNLADKHETHVATALCAIAALKKAKHKPSKLYLAECWRGLDWMCDDDKLVMPNRYPGITKKQVECFESQVAGGKRYDKACIGRQLANATFYQSHSVDDFEYCNYVMDATELIYGGDPSQFIESKLKNFESDVMNMINRLK